MTGDEPGDRGVEPASLGIDTVAVWGGEEAGFAYGSTHVPLVNSVAFAYQELDRWLAVARDETPGHIYTRNTNPTVAVFEEKVRLLECGQAATSFASGMAAISDTLYALLAQGSRVVTVRDTYGGTTKVIADHLPAHGIAATVVETETQAVVEAIAAGCDLVHLETPTNPTLKVLDVRAVADAAHEHGAVVVVDNTIATPVNQQPLFLGADLVVHSATKYLGGHADALGGVLVGRADLVERVFRFREVGGAALAPSSASLLIRGMKTLALRVGRQNESAGRIARFLRRHPKIEEVFYPGLSSDPQHEVARRQMLGFGGVLSFVPVGGFASVSALLPRLRFAHRAANLGAVETIVGPPATTSHVERTPEERAAFGIPEGLIRYSTGIEDVDDLIGSLSDALDPM